jgi:chromosome segregation protein
MRLKKIEIKGFKSFYKKTSLIFPKTEDKKNGVVAIVGPNGSGKSNICDALKWGLGVQSKKGFRSKKSKDVIFAGSSLKRPLSSAYVSLYFDNRKKKIPLDYKDVIITRKIYNSGENEYFINNGKTKLKEVLQILGQAGIGQQSYSIVDQGMADRLILINPLERKKIIEEAAKVKHFQIKKEDSLRRMENSKINMEKAQALMREINPRLKYLESQAKKKIKQEKIEKEFRKKAKQYFGILWKNLIEKKKPYLKNKNILEEELKSILKKISETRNLLEKNPLRTSLENSKGDTNQKRIADLREEENNFLKQISILEGKREIIKDKIDFQKSISRQKIDLPYVKRKLEILLEDLDKLKSKEKLDLRDLEAIRKIIAKLKSELVKGIVKRENLSLIANLEKEIEENQQQSYRLKEKLANLEQEKKLLSLRIKEEEEEENKKRLEQHKLERNFDVALQNKDSLQEKIKALEIELAKIEVDENNLKERASNTLNISIEKIKYQELNTEEINYNKLEKEIEKLSQQINICGSISWETVKEYKETLARFSFLEKETADIQKTVHSLKKIIKNLEEKIEKRFSAAFAKINKDFNNYFKIIFKGGNAKLIKVEGTDPESNQEKTQIGIDIKAFPPAKKIKNISMLSGGEKALTSLAFLFAIISNSNPPFVMLDEVDVALDETNSVRFSRIVKEIAKKTQVITITHNREIMKEAQILYGVTMQKSGISELLSVNLQKT